MVLPVCDEDGAARADGDALQPLELALGRAPATEAAEERPVRVEDLDSVVAAVRHEDVALVVHGDTPENGRD